MREYVKMFLLKYTTLLWAKIIPRPDAISQGTSGRQTVEYKTLFRHS